MATFFVKHLPADHSPRRGTDIYGEATYITASKVWLSVIHLGAGSIETSVRADSSGSRGRNDENAPTGKVLMQPVTNPKVQDRLVAAEVSYLISHVEPRYGAMGGLDHYEVDLIAKAV